MLKSILKAQSHEQVFLSIIDIALGIAEADFGNIQLIDPATHSLKIIAQRGFPQFWLDYWQNVKPLHGTCGTAIPCNSRIMVEDVCNSPLFNGRDLEMQLSVGVRAVQSTPIVTRNGKTIGIFFTHYKEPHKFNQRSLHLLDLLARQAANTFEQLNMQHKLEEAQAKLKSSLTLREEFISLISHELRSPLTSMILHTQNCRQLLTNSDDSKQQLAFFINIIMSELANLEDLINTLLDITAIDHDKLNFNCKQIDVHQVITMTLKRFPNDIIYEGSRLEAYWDPHRINQVVTNLLSNAIKYGDGKPVKLELIQYTNEFRINVIDQGIGIREEDKQKIFRKFERLDALHSAMGLGLGLYIIKKIVDASRGRITVDSQPGKGTCFSVDLPLISNRD